ncbi:MAG: hypothetical protein J3R72DRAFT_484719 [Linnemannia gamsii]|nr:MAG: hypothetical protein J3R72DRAFT_484719 [Linnemannia gamsii]
MPDAVRVEDDPDAHLRHQTPEAVGSSRYRYFDQRHLYKIPSNLIVLRAMSGEELGLDGNRNRACLTPVTPNIPLSAVDEPFNNSSGPTLDENNSDDYNVVSGISMNPESFMESKLERLTLCGPWVITAPDLVVLYRNHDHIEGNKVLVDGSVAEIENEVSYSTGTITENATTTTAAKDKQVIGTPYLKAPSLSRPLPLPPMTNMQRPLSGRSLVEVSSSFNVALKEP